MRKIILTLLLLLAAGCAKKEEKEAEPVVPVQLAPVRAESIRRLVTADAVLYPVDQASVAPKIGAPVRRFYVNRGDHVKRGQLLAVLEDRDLVAAAVAGKGQLDQAEANYRGTSGASVPEELGKARAEAAAARQALDAAQKLLESRERLYREGALARRLVDEARVSEAQARSQSATAQDHLRALESIGRHEQVKAAAAQVEAARGQYQAAEAQAAYARILSPIDGVIADRPLYAGEMAGAGAPLLTVMDTSRVVARANIPQNLAAELRVGQPATIAGEGGELAGKVMVVSPAVDANATTVQVWVVAANPGEHLKPGATVRTTIVAATLADAAVVPATAILPGEGGGASVMVVDNESVAHQKNVELGARDSGKVQILSGVRPGEQVVVEGGVGLRDGAKVKAQKPQ